MLSPRNLQVGSIQVELHLEFRGVLLMLACTAAAVLSSLGATKIEFWDMLHPSCLVMSSRAGRYRGLMQTSQKDKRWGEERPDSRVRIKDCREASGLRDPDSKI